MYDQRERVWNSGKDMARRRRILIVEDEKAIAVGLTDVFIFHGFDVTTIDNGEAGLKAALTLEYDLLLLDVMLPVVDGFSICNKVREKDREQPIIMLTAKTSDEDIIQGLTLGADDYVAKPFSIQELVLRVEAVLKRSGKLRLEESRIKLASGLVIDGVLKIGTLPEGKEIPLTRREVDILIYLSTHLVTPVSRGELLEEVWGYRKAVAIDTRTVDIHIAKLRKKIEKNATDPKNLITVRGEGYQLVLDTKSDDFECE